MPRFITNALFTMLVISPWGTAIAQSPSSTPGETSLPAASPAAGCTRGTNPYQDLKDRLNIVHSQLSEADREVKASNVKRVAKLGKHIRRDWKKVTAQAKKSNRELPANLSDDVKAAAKALRAARKSLDAAKTLDLNALAKRIDDLSLTMTCP